MEGHFSTARRKNIPLKCKTMTETVTKLVTEIKENEIRNKLNINAKGDRKGAERNSNLIPRTRPCDQ